MCKMGDNRILDLVKQNAPIDTNITDDEGNPYWTNIANITIASGLPFLNPGTLSQQINKVRPGKDYIATDKSRTSFLIGGSILPQAFKNPCDEYTSTSTNISQNCYNYLWRNNGCITEAPSVKPSQTLSSIKADIFNTSAGEAPPNPTASFQACYGDNKALWPSECVYTNWVLKNQCNPVTLSKEYERSLVSGPSERCIFTKKSEPCFSEENKKDICSLLQDSIVNDPRYFMISSAKTGAQYDDNFANNQCLTYNNNLYFALRNRQSGVCVRPWSGGGNVVEGDLLVFHTDACNSSFTNRQFYIDLRGAIRHRVSGACVTINNSDQLVLSYQNCGDTWTFTPNGSLKHVSSGRCVHPFNGDVRYYNNTWTPLILFDQWCDNDKLYFDRMYETDPYGRLVQSSYVESSPCSLGNQNQLFQITNDQRLYNVGAKSYGLETTKDAQTGIASKLQVRDGWDANRRYFVRDQSGKIFVAPTPMYCVTTDASNNAYLGSCVPHTFTKDNNVMKEDPMTPLCMMALKKDGEFKAGNKIVYAPCDPKDQAQKFRFTDTDALKHLQSNLFVVRDQSAGLQLGASATQNKFFFDNDRALHYTKDDRKCLMRDTNGVLSIKLCSSSDSDNRVFQPIVNPPQPQDKWNQLGCASFTNLDAPGNINTGKKVELCNTFKTLGLNETVQKMDCVDKQLMCNTLYDKGWNIRNITDAEQREIWTALDCDRKKTRTCSWASGTSATPVKTCVGGEVLSDLDWCRSLSTGYFPSTSAQYASQCDAIQLSYKGSGMGGGMPDGL